MVANIQAALSEHIAALDWMSDETKAKAQEKLSAFTVKIGYPDNWKDYSTLEIDPQLSYYQNMVYAMNWYSEDNLSKLGKPVDKIPADIGRLQTRHQQRMIVSRHRIRGRTGRKSAQPVGQEPAVFLAPLLRFKVILSIDKFHIRQPFSFPERV